MKSVIIATVLVSLSLLQGRELLRNGSFEKPGTPDISFNRISKNPLRQLERSSVKAKTGLWSLRSISRDLKAGPAVELRNLKCTPGKKYRFSFAFFVTAREKEAKVSARIAYLNSANKVVRYSFPVFKSTPGEWHTPSLTFYPPVNCTRISITLWLDGRQTLYLDDFSFAEITEKALPNLNAGALELQKNAGCTIWKEVPYLKVPAAGVPAGIKKGKSVSVSAAANESEPFQIVITPQKNIQDISLEFSPLKGEKKNLPASVVSYKRVGFINLKNPDNPAIKGLNADPLFPETRASAVKGRNLPFFIRVNVPPKTPAGIYRGEFRVLSGKKILGRFQLKLRVFDFELPRLPRLQTYFYARPFPAYDDFDKRTFDQKAENFHKIMAEHRFTGNQALFPPMPKWGIKNGQLRITDWSVFDREVERRHKTYGQLNFPVPTMVCKGFSQGWAGTNSDKPGKSSYGPFNLVSPEGLKYAAQFVAEFTAHVEKKFPHLDFFGYIYDEPPAKVRADLKKLLDAMHSGSPKFKTFIPKQVSDDIGYVHTFCVPLSPGYINFALHDAHKKKGGRIWYYNWRVRMSNHNYIDNRIYPWQVYSADGSGALLWNTIWTQKGINPWTDLDRTYACGAATIFYPPRKAAEGNIPSQRAALIREGIDDYDYMKLLEELIDSRYPGAGRPRVMEIIKKLIPVPPFNFVNDSHLLYRLREELAREIEEFKKLPVTVLSLPVPGSRTELSTVKFKVLAPAGAKILVDGKLCGTVQKNKVLEIEQILKKLGVNTFKLQILSQGKRSTVERQFELMPDPRLKELEKLIVRAGKEGINAVKAAAFLKKVHSGIAYTLKEKKQTALLIGEIKYEISKKLLNRSRSFINPLEEFFFRRAREVFNWKQFERSEYYLALAADAAKCGNMKNFKVRLNPVTFKGHSALCFDNGIIKATILETGATVASFKVNGVETLRAGTFDKLLSPRERSARKTSKNMVTRLAGYDGYADTGSIGNWPISYVDWNIKIRELSPDKITLCFETPLPDSSFHFSRTVTLKKGSADLVMDYEIRNLMSPDAASEDPEHFQLGWRGRAVPAVGPGPVPQMDDTLVVPVKFPADKLDPDTFIKSRPTKRILASVRLKHPYMGAFDTKLKKGIALIGGPVMTHGAVWFDSGKGKIYTAEFSRNYFGRKYNDKDPNSPLSIPPGKSLNFTVILRGLQNVSSSADLTRQAGF